MRADADQEFDAARAALLAATVPAVRDEILHIGPDSRWSQRDAFEAFLAQLGWSAPA